MSDASGIVRVAAAQVAPRVGDVDGNRARALAAIQDAVDEGAAVVVLPELVSSGYVFESRDEAIRLAETPSDPTVSSWVAAAQRHGVVVVGGFCELGESGELYNAAAVVDPQGVRSVYRKVHLWDREKAVFEPGNELPPIVRTEHGSLGVGICYDIEFPELTRSLALAGADILVFPTNSPDLGQSVSPYPMEVVVAMATAHVNRTFVVVADRCGLERGIDWVGATVVVGVDGVPLAGPPAERKPGLLVADCDLRLARDKRWGPVNDLFADRRPDVYSQLGGVEKAR